MKVQFTHFADRGVPNRERLYMRVNAPTDLSFFVVLNTFVSAPGKVASTPRHAFWFPSVQVAAGDEVVLYTGPGVNATTPRADGGTSHVFFWGQGSTLWNAPSDCAVVMEVWEWFTALPPA